ncbi:peptidase inhibitor i9 [Rhizoctonia solani AG-3 Rhs1AP]|uniref:Peptidase inhibitor i9 n=1 Tax=Rhizoctonia solani AG-3 Rhs1AP TaxID=1086054 RepID=A0A0A1UJE5_9AGAM|nr:peptidase inhibitor i9 [Rhizoctonia solani AG-3 Rhs1AP]
MLFKSLVFLFSVLTFSALAAPTSRIPILKHVGRVKEHSYIVQLKPEASKSTHLARLPTSGLTLAYTYDQAFHGYAARLDTAALEQIRQSQDVEAIYEDGIVMSDAVLSNADNQTFSTRPIDTRENSSRRDGSSVDVYDIGTGIYTAHTSFGGRAHWGITFGGVSLAGIAVGTMYGIATQANIYAVKSMSDSGSGAISDIIAGINWVISSVKTSSRPSVVMLGAGGSVNTALDAAVVSATSQGIHFIVPAPTSNAGTSSPARVVSAVTVDVVGQSYTSGVDVCSKGTAVPCPSIQGPTASMTISAVGAAMARVAGIVASVLGTYGNASPASIETALKTHTSTTTNGCLVINTPW